MKEKEYLRQNILENFVVITSFLENLLRKKMMVVVFSVARSNLNHLIHLLVKNIFSFHK